MKLSRIYIENFLSFKSASLSLAEKGLVSIQGINLDKTGSDSNGSGKSSIINAILWCLYGSYGKGGMADEVVNSYTGKNCVVRTTWTSPTESYEIVRYRKHFGHKNDIVIRRIESTPVGDKYHNITKAGKLAQEQINEIIGCNETVFRASCFMQQENPIDIPSMTDRQLKELLESALPMEEIQERHKKATEQLTIAYDEYYTKEKNYTRLRDTFEATLSQYKLFCTEYENYEASVESKKEETFEKIRLLKTERAELLLTKIEPETHKHLLQYEAKIKSFSKDTNVSSAETLLKTAKLEAMKIEKNIASPKVTCSSCGQKVLDEKIYIEQQEKLLLEAKTQIIKAQNYLAEVSINHSKFLALEKAYKELQLKMTTNSVINERKKYIEQALKDALMALKTISVNPYALAKNRYAALVRDSLGPIETAKEECEKAKETLELARAVELTYSPKGIRYYILEEAAPTLTASTNYYLELLTDGKIKAIWSTVTRTSTGDFREKFSIQAEMEGRKSFELLSGGEKRKVRLACFFALQDLIASRATKNIELWCADEIEQALDPAGMERLMTVLYEKVKTKKTILVISHNELQEWIPNTATVTRKDGISTITGYLNG